MGKAKRECNKIMDTLLKDLRYSFRMLLKKPGFTVIAVLALAIGIGANSAIFSVINTVLLRPLPYNNPDRLIAVMEQSPQRGYPEMPISYANFADWVDQNHVFEELAAFRTDDFTLTGIGEPERVSGTRVSASLFPMLETQPLSGRVFGVAEDKPGAERVVVLSYRMWQRHFGSDPNVLGQPITLDDESYTIIGIMPQSFRFPAVFTYAGKTVNQASDFWVPIAPALSETPRGSHSSFAIGRLKAGVTLEEARAEMAAIESRLEQQYPDENTAIESRLLPLHEQAVAYIRPALMVLLSAVGFVLLIACTNVANLLLARAATRHKEIAIRTALGAGRLRLIRQLLTESLLLSLTGGGLGLLLAMWAVDGLAAIGPQDIPRLNEIGLDRWVLLFTFAVSVATGLIFGLVPALQASKPNLTEVLKDGARGATSSLRNNRIRSILVTTEIALSLLLLVGAGLMLRSFIRLQQVDPGFRTDNILTLNLSLSESRYPEKHQIAGFFQEAINKVRALPGVEAVGATSELPLSGGMSTSGFDIEGRPAPPPDEKMMAGNRAISPDYFSTMGISFIKGRDFTDMDNEKAAGVAIINQSLARLFFRDEDPIGKRVSWDAKTNQWYSIVGVVSDIRHASLDEKAEPEIYLPYLQRPKPSLTLAIRTHTDSESMLSAVRSEIQSIDKDQPIDEAMTMNQYLSDSISQRRFNTLLLGLFATLALGLALVGIYGVMSYSVTQRTHEIGIRMALGAKTTDVLKLVVGQGLMLALAGIAAGLAASFALTRLLSDLLYEVSATDFLTFASVSVLLAIAALLASYIPARRATRVDPMVALRYE